MHSEKQGSASVDSSQFPGFETAVPVDGQSRAQDDVKACHNCGIALLEGDIYSINGKLTCDYCAPKIKSRATPAKKSTPTIGGGMQGALYGALAAMGAAVAYALVAISTGFEIGFMALGVGWVVGWSVKRGANGHVGGGLRVLAMLFVYLSLVAAQIGIGIHQLYEASDSQGKQRIEQLTENLNRVGGSGAVVGTVGIAFFIAALIYPFTSGLFGVLFVVIGLFEAWKISGQPPSEDSGPVRVRPGVS